MLVLSTFIPSIDMHSCNDSCALAVTTILNAAILSERNYCPAAHFSAAVFAPNAKVIGTSLICLSLWYSQTTKWICLCKSQ